jgi:hypothetical protein
MLPMILGVLLFNLHGASRGIGTRSCPNERLASLFGDTEAVWR